MKTALLAILFACATGAIAQNAPVLSNQVAPFQITDHPEHARNHNMALDQNLRGDESPYTYAKGELPLSDFARASTSVPLGDVARRYKQAHAAAAKARVVWDN